MDTVTILSSPFEFPWYHAALIAGLENMIMFRGGDWAASPPLTYVCNTGGAEEQACPNSDRWLRKHSLCYGNTNGSEWIKLQGKLHKGAVALKQVFDPKPGSEADWSGPKMTELRWLLNCQDPSESKSACEFGLFLYFEAILHKHSLIFHSVLRNFCSLVTTFKWIMLIFHI